MNTNFNKIYERRNTNCFKWDRTREMYGREDVISMWVADMDLPTCKVIQDAIMQRAQHPLFGYTFRNDDYFMAFIDWQKKYNNWQIKRDWILNSTSVVVSLNMIIRTFTQKDDKILIFTPVYSQFSATVNDTERQIVNCPLINGEDEYLIDYKDLENKLSMGVKIVILCSPHNPVGRVWRRDELKKIGELCVKYNSILVTDEIHSDLIYSESSHIPAASISPEISMNTITCMAPGKTFNVSGLSIGFIIAENPVLREKVKATYMSHHLMAANIFGITACETAYRHCRPWLDSCITYLEGNRDFLLNYIADHLPLIKVKKPQGTYLAWLDFSAYKLTHSQLQCFLVQAAGIGLDNGTKFGEEGNCFMRWNFALSRILLKKALIQLKTATDKLVAHDFDLSKVIDDYEDIADCD